MPDASLPAVGSPWQPPSYQAASYFNQEGKLWTKQTTKIKCNKRHQCKEGDFWTETVIYICFKLLSHNWQHWQIAFGAFVVTEKISQLLIWRVMLLRTCWKWILNVKYVENTRALIILIEKWKWFFVKAAFDILKGKEIHLRSC